MLHKYRRTGEELGMNISHLSASRPPARRLTVILAIEVDVKDERPVKSPLTPPSTSHFSANSFDGFEPSLQDLLDQAAHNANRRGVSESKAPVIYRLHWNSDK